MKTITKRNTSVNSQPQFHIEIRPHMTKVKKTGCPPPCTPPGKRGSIEGLSVASGLRLQETIASVDPGHGHPLFVTLTYPAEWPGEWDTWKKQLHNFRRTLNDQDWVSPVGAIWRLEAQRRGAPHFHLLLWVRCGKDRATMKAFKAWLSSAWFRIVGSEDPKHLKAGTNCKVVDTEEALQGVMSYLGKYVGKSSVHPESQCFGKPVGRYWGIWNKKTLLEAPIDISINRDQFCKSRRVLKNYKRSKAKTAKKPLKRSIEGRNGAPRRQREIPGTRCFMPQETAERLVGFIDPVPF